MSTSNKPSRRAPATAFSPVDDNNKNANSGGNLVPAPRSNNKTTTNTNNTTTNNNTNYDPAMFSTTVRGKNMSSRMSTVINTLRGQFLHLTALRDTFANDENSFVAQKICTLARQLESIYAEAGDLVEAMKDEDVKLMPSTAGGAEESSSTSGNTNNNNNTNMAHHLFGDGHSQQLVANQKATTESAFTDLGASGSSKAQGGRATRRPVAVPFSSTATNNNKDSSSPPDTRNSPPSTTGYEPMLSGFNNANAATLDFLEKMKTSSTSSNKKSNDESQQQQDPNNTNQQQQLPPPPPPPPQKPAPKFVRAQTLINQAEIQHENERNNKEGGANNSKLPSYTTNANGKMLKGGGAGGGAGAAANDGGDQYRHYQPGNIGQNQLAAGESSNPANDLKGPGRRLSRGEPHQFCIIEFKCNRMKRFPYDSSAGKVQPGRYVICWGDKGEDCGLCVMTGFCDEEGKHTDIKTFKDANVELHKVRIVSDVFILRAATREDVGKLHNDIANLEKEALQKCQEIAARRGMSMKFTDCEVQFDRQKFTFYFDATYSVDFRDLTRELHKEYKARIWLENINGNVKNVVPEGALSQADKKVFAARGVQLNFRQ